MRKNVCWGLLLLATLCMQNSLFGMEEEKTEARVELERINAIVDAEERLDEFDTFLSDRFDINIDAPPAPEPEELPETTPKPQPVRPAGAADLFAEIRGFKKGGLKKAPALGEGAPAPAPKELTGQEALIAELGKFRGLKKRTPWEKPKRKKTEAEEMAELRAKRDDPNQTLKPLERTKLEMYEIKLRRQSRPMQMAPRPKKPPRRPGPRVRRKRTAPPLPTTPRPASPPRVRPVQTPPPLPQQTAAEARRAQLFEELERVRQEMRGKRGGRLLRLRTREAEILSLIEGSFQ